MTKGHNLFIQKGFPSKGLFLQSFLSCKVIFPKIFILKGHYLKDFYLDGSSF